MVGSGLLIRLRSLCVFTRPAYSFTVARANSVSATRRQLRFSSSPPYLASCLPAPYCQLAILLGSVSVRVSWECVGLWACLWGGKTPRISEGLSGVCGPVGMPMRWEDAAQNVSGTRESWGSPGWMCGVNTHVSTSPVLETHRNGQAALTQDKLREMARPFFALSVNVVTECRKHQPQCPPNDISLSCI